MEEIRRLRRRMRKSMTSQIILRRRTSMTSTRRVRMSLNYRRRISMI